LHPKRQSRSTSNELSAQLQVVTVANLSGKAAQQQSSKRQSRSTAKHCQTAAKPLNSKAQSGKAAQPQSIVKHARRCSRGPFASACQVNDATTFVVKATEGQQTRRLQ